MKRPDRATAILGSVVLAATLAVGAFSVSAAGGDQGDPLVTLSYLNQVVTPELTSRVDKQVAANEQALLDKINAAIASYSGQTGGQGASYVPVNLSAGWVLLPEAGCEVLLRSGEAKLDAGSALLDTTAGSTLESGGALAANHLYVASQEGCAAVASSDAVFLVRGGYSVR